MSARVLRAQRRGPTVLKREVLDAQAQAVAILRQAEQQAEALREAARQEGREEGARLGAEQMATELAALARARSELLDELEPQVIELALLAAKQIIAAELDSRPQRVAEMVAPLLQRVRRAKQVSLRVHPDDGPAVRQLLKGQLSHAFRLETDPALTRGGCVVESDIGTLDARIEVRLSALAKALRK